VFRNLNLYISVKHIHLIQSVNVKFSVHNLDTITGQGITNPVNFMRFISTF
jgi:hypothetical protein